MLPQLRATLPEVRLILHEIAVPVLWQYTATHEAVKRGIRPVAHAGNQPMLDGIEMDMVDMSLEIPLVANCMLPEATLPQRNLSSGGARPH